MSDLSLSLSHRSSSSSTRMPFKPIESIPLATDFSFPVTSLLVVAQCNPGPKHQPRRPPFSPFPKQQMRASTGHYQFAGFRLFITVWSRKTCRAKKKKQIGDNHKGEVTVVAKLLQCKTCHEPNPERKIIKSRKRNESRFSICPCERQAKSTKNQNPCRM